MMPNELLYSALLNVTLAPAPDPLNADPLMDVDDFFCDALHKHGAHA